MKVTFLISFILLASSLSVSATEEKEKLEFGYVGSIGPANWHLLSEESKVCLTGKNQSPIDITSQDLKTLAKPPPAEFKNAKDVESFNNGNTVEIFSGKEGVPLPATIQVDGETYDLQQFHFHTPSEHRVNGKHFDIEQHLVFTTKDEKVSVVAVFYDVGKEESKFMAPIVKDLPKEKDDKKKIEEIDLSGLLTDIKNITAAFTYSGSLTTPPCTEGVTWYVNKDAQVVSLDQFLGLREVTGFNSRFTQLRSNDTTKEKHVKKRSLYKFDRFLK
ncbi:3477_t:CDS:1 [Funneliformis caledonium]|uniref:carbonic anhydrase n=1 Tax=Funneliformis caledonium TaxID=1117310 RepID=A0A9N9FN28_9GLOM|nr:3477_t:CDS:1 [Funneliformis caledonium]